MGIDLVRGAFLEMGFALFRLVSYGTDFTIFLSIYSMILIYNLRIFRTSVSWWLYLGVWVTVSLLKSPGHFSVFWLISSIISIRPLIPKSSSPFTKTLVTVPNVPMLYSRNTNISRNIIKHNIRTSTNERTNFFINIYPSHIILERLLFVVCESWAGDGTDCYIDPSSSDHSSTSFSSWLGLLNRGSLRAQRPLSAAGSHFGILSPTDSNRMCTWLYYCLTSTCFRCSSAYLHRCISWLTARSRVNK